MFEAIGNIGSFIGGIGVALSVVYLAVQIRISSQTAKASAAQIVMQSMSEYFRSVSENAQLAKVITIAYKNIDSLEESEITQFFFWSLSYWRRCSPTANSRTRVRKGKE